MKLLVVDSPPSIIIYHGISQYVDKGSMPPLYPRTPHNLPRFSSSPESWPLLISLSSFILLLPVVTKWTPVCIPLIWYCPGLYGVPPSQKSLPFISRSSVPIWGCAPLFAHHLHKNKCFARLLTSRTRGVPLGVHTLPVVSPLPLYPILCWRSFDITGTPV